MVGLVRNCGKMIKRMREDDVKNQTRLETFSKDVYTVFERKEERKKGVKLANSVF